jgi:hypothetical protein
MIVQIVMERNRSPHSRGFLGRKDRALGTMCLVLYVELSVALRVLLQLITGKSWFFTSLAIPFLLVALLYVKLEEWFWAEPAGRSDPGLPAASPPVKSETWEAVPPQTTAADPASK